MTLTKKLTLVLLGLALGMLVSAVVPVYLLEQRRFLSRLEASQVADLQRFARVCADSLAAGDERARLEYLKTYILFLRQTLRTPSGATELLATPLMEISSPQGARRAASAMIAYDRSAMEASLGSMRRELSFGRALSRPIEVLGEGARLIGQGKLETRIPEDRDDKLGALARRFNGMAAKLAELDELKDSFLAQITHDLRNPLNAIMA